VQSLWAVLFPGPANIQPDFGTDAEGSEVKATEAFAQLIGTMQQVFGGLKTAEDWVKLYRRLCDCDQLRTYNFGRLAATLPWPELNYMVHHLMGAVSPLGIGLLDGLGRVSATKLASMSLYPATTYGQLINPHGAFARCSEKGLRGVPRPDFRVMGEPGIVKCIALNQGGTLGQASLHMCREFSKGVQNRATQATKIGLRDLMSDFLNKAFTERREKHAFVTTAENLGKSIDLLRAAAYDIIFEEKTSNYHLELVQTSESKKKSLASVKAECVKKEWGRKTNGGPTECNLKAHPLVSWLVYLMTNGFFFATNGPTTKVDDRSYREMLILLRNNGKRLDRVNLDDLYKTGTDFKVRLFIS
jgi:hypothetical protein